MKIAQITLNGYSNYGQIFQKYAMHHTLKKFADVVEVLHYNRNLFFPEVGGNYGFLRPHPPTFNAEQMYFFEAARITKFKEFLERYVNTRFDLPYIEEIADDYDFFCVGSDQVWNPNYWLPDELAFLKFVPREKRIAYAASIAQPELPPTRKEAFRRGIAGFDYVSVREEGAVKLISDLGLEPPPLVLDPVFLLTRDEWLTIARPPSWFNKKYSRGYIFTYYLRNVPPPEVDAISKKLNLPVINLINPDNFNHYVVGPDEFIFLLANASLFCTNSFHGVVFSILFKRPFLNIEYVDELTKAMSLRIPGILKMFGLEDRTSTVGNFKFDSPFEIDFSTRDKILPLERQKAFQFLAGALKVQMTQDFSAGGEAV